MVPIVVTSPLPSPPVVMLPCPRSGDVLLLPAIWPVRLGPAERRALAEQLLAYDDGAELPAPAPIVRSC